MGINVTMGADPIRTAACDGEEGNSRGTQARRAEWAARWDALDEPRTPRLTPDVWSIQPSSPDGLQRRGEDDKKKEERRKKKKQLHVYPIRVMAKLDSGTTEGTRGTGPRRRRLHWVREGKRGGENQRTLVSREKNCIYGASGMKGKKGTGGHLQKVTFHEAKIILEIKPRPS